jgi:transcriptional regulator with XRE-family HTH domain
MQAMNEEDPGPVVQRLILGERLRALREASGVSLDDANAKVKWYRGKLSKVENGTLGLTERELSTLLTYYDVPGPEAARVKKLGVEARRRAAPERVTDWAKQYIPLERAASEIRMVYDEIPGLLQTREWAKVYLASSPVVLAADIDRMAQAREERRERLTRANAPKVWAVLGEGALLRIKPPEIRLNQLRKLRDIADLRNVSLTVVPFEAGPLAGLSYPFTLLWIEPANATIAYVDHMTGADYVRATSAYTLAYDRAADSALSEEDTKTLLDQHINDLYEKGAPDDASGRRP